MGDDAQVDDHDTIKRIREFLAILAVLLVVAGVGALVVACTRK